MYISGDPNSLTSIYADNEYTIDILPSGASFDAPEHWAHQHPVVELTSGMRPGSNTFTLIVVKTVTFLQINITQIESARVVI